MTERIYYEGNWIEVGGGIQPFDYTNKFFIDSGGLIHSGMSNSYTFRFASWTSDGIAWNTWTPPDGGVTWALSSDGNHFQSTALFLNDAYLFKSMSQKQCWRYAASQAVQPIFAYMNSSDQQNAGYVATDGSVLVTVGVRAGGSSWGVYYTTDGEHWTSSYVNSGVPVGLHYGNGIWVVSGPTTTAYTSTNGTSWGSTTFSKTSGSSVWFRSGVWFELSANLIRRSSGLTVSNGNWVTVNSTSGTVTSLVGNGNGTFIAVRPASVLCSTDNGSTWTETKVGSGMRHAGYVNGTFIVTQSSYGTEYYTSTDGSTWTTRNFAENAMVDRAYQFSGLS